MDLICQGVDPAVANQLCGVMRKPIRWRVVPNAPEGASGWEGKVDGWTFALMDFCIAAQTGRAGDRLQNVGISNAKLGLAIGDDQYKKMAGEQYEALPGMSGLRVIGVNRKLMQDVAALLLSSMKAEDVFEGSGKLSMDDEAGSEQRMEEGNLDLRLPADLRRAVEWQTAHCNMLTDGGIWGMSGVTFQCFKSQKRVVVTDGDLGSHSLHLSVRIAFLAMGWVIQESTAHPEETRIAEMWAKRYKQGLTPPPGRGWPMPPGRS